MIYLLGVGILTLVGLGIRFWKIDHGLPHFFYSDEGIFTYLALNMGGQGLNPHYFLHPNLFLYLLLFLDGAFTLGGMAMGIFTRPGDAWQLYVQDPTVFYVIGRSASAVLGTLTIPLTYLIGKKVFNERVGFLGAFFLTFAFLPVQWSQLAYSDSLHTFLTTLAFFFAFRASQEGNIRNFVLAGLISGLSASTKYQGLATLLWGPLASSFFAHKNKMNPVTQLFGKRSFLFLLFFVLGFTLGTPFWIFEFDRFQREVLWNWANLKTHGLGQLGYEGNWNWFYYLNTALTYGLGLPLGICGLFGIILLASQRKLENLFFIAFPTIYFLGIGFSRVRQAKYLLPAFPFLCVAVGFFLVTAITKMMGRESKRSALVYWLAAFLIVLPTLLDTGRNAYLRMFPDNRESVYAWIRENIPQESRVLKSYYVFLPEFSGGPEIKLLDTTLIRQNRKHHTSLKSLEQYRKEGFEYLILDEWQKGLALIEAARQANRQDVVERYQKFFRDLEASGTLVASFSPYRDKDVPFDRENVELPSRSLWKMKSTGPKVWIYKL